MVTIMYVDALYTGQTIVANKNMLPRSLLVLCYSVKVVVVVHHAMYLYMTVYVCGGQWYGGGDVCTRNFPQTMQTTVW